MVLGKILRVVFVVIHKIWKICKSFYQIGGFINHDTFSFFLLLTCKVNIKSNSKFGAKAF